MQVRSGIASLFMLFACVMLALASPLPDTGIALPGSGDTAVSWLDRLLSDIPLVGPLTKSLGISSPPAQQQQPAQAKPQTKPPQQPQRPAARPQQPAAPQQQRPGPQQQRPGPQQQRPAPQQMPQQRPAPQQMPQQRPGQQQMPQQAPGQQQAPQQRPAGLANMGSFGGGFPGFQ